MDLLIYLFITILLVFIFFNILPFLVPVFIVLFLINVLRRAFLRKQYKETDSTYYEQNTNTNPNVIDVEYTEREDDGE